MKLKNKAFVTIFSVIASSVMLVSAPSAANAGDCSPSDPCETWAMVDGSGTVTNIIVCQPSVCGSGYFGNSRVVRQVAASSTGQNQGGWVNDSNNNISVTESSGTFTLANTSPVTSTNVEVNGDATTVVTTVVHESEAKTFTYEDTVGKELSLAPEGQGIDYTPAPISDGTNADVIIAHYESGTVMMDLNVTFESRQIEDVVKNTLIKKSTELEENPLFDNEKKENVILSSMVVIRKLLRMWMYMVD